MADCPSSLVNSVLIVPEAVSLSEKLPWAGWLNIWLIWRPLSSGRLNTALK